jgi:DNA-binding MarR family transcriptional regulator
LKGLNRLPRKLIIVLFVIQLAIPIFQGNKLSETEFISESIIINSRIVTDGLEIISPNGGEILSNTITIEWSLASEFINLSVPEWYNVYYSPNGGRDWIQLGFMISDKNMVWNTTLYEEYNTNCLLQVIASSKNWYDKVDISDYPFTIDNRIIPPPSPNDPLAQTIFSLILLAIIAISGYLILNPLIRSPLITIGSLLQSEEIDVLQAIRNKVIIGLENIKSGFIPESYTFTTLELPSPTSSMVEYFPLEFQNELRSKMKGRTVLTLIEIAYQDPSETNPNRLAKSLNIPLSTLSKEIKKLTEMKYVESYVSAQVLEDGRYRNFKITSKGFSFLAILNTTLKIAIDKLKENSVYGL